MKSYKFLSGLPRSGSTLLATLLNQHPNVHASGTSALLELLLALSNSVQFNRTFYEIADVQEILLYKSIIEAFYNHINKNVIFDKHRLWPNFVGPLNKMGIDAKILCTLRPIPEIISSYITLIDKNPNYPNLIDEIVSKRNLPINTQNRAMVIWDEYIRIPHTALKNTIKTNRKHLFFVTYDDLVNYPVNTLHLIADFFGFESFQGYQFDNIVNSQVEKDGGWKIKDLHEIRPTLNKISKPAEEVIGKILTEYYSQYDIKELC